MASLRNRSPTSDAAGQGRGKTEVAHFDSGIPVQICGRVLNIHRQHADSLNNFTRELANQLKANHVSIQLSDKYGTPINGDLELKSAIFEKRAPLQASLKISALREIEQRKNEAENKKEELSQFQWQVLVDEISAVGKQVSALAGQLHQVQDDCASTVRTAKQEWELNLSSLDRKIDRETSVRETNVRDVDVKLEKIVTAICSERSARDVANHNLDAQLKQFDAKIEADRTLRSQERAEFERRVAALAHKVDSHTAKAEEQWTCYAEAMTRTDASLEELHFSDSAMKKRLNDMEGSSDRVRSDLATLSNNLSMYQRQTQEMVGRRAEELSQAIRDEIVGRENHIARFARELETSWQIFESRMQRGREEASQAVAQVGERVRVAENRCSEIEKDIQLALSIQNDSAKLTAGKFEAMSASIDGLQISVQSNDVVVQTTTAKVDELCKRTDNIEVECSTKITAEYWMPHVNSMERAAAKLEEKLEILQKDVSGLFVDAASYSTKKEVQDMLTKSLDKLSKVPSCRVASPSNLNGSSTSMAYAVPKPSQEPVAAHGSVIKTGTQRPVSPTKVLVTNCNSGIVRTSGVSAASVKGIISPSPSTAVTAATMNFHM